MCLDTSGPPLPLPLAGPLLYYTNFSGARRRLSPGGGGGGGGASSAVSGPTARAAFFSSRGAQALLGAPGAPVARPAHHKGPPGFMRYMKAGVSSGRPGVFPAPGALLLGTLAPERHSAAVRWTRGRRTNPTRERRVVRPGQPWSPGADGIFHECVRCTRRMRCAYGGHEDCVGPSPTGIGGPHQPCPAEHRNYFDFFTGQCEHGNIVHLEEDGFVGSCRGADEL